MSEALIGSPVTSLTIRVPSFQNVLSSFLPGSGPRSRRPTTSGRPNRPIAANRVLRISGRRPMPDSSRPMPELREGLVAVGLGGGGRVAVLDDLDVRHQLAGPLDDADADEQQREAQRDAQGDVGGTEPADGRLVAVLDVQREVGDAEQHRADHGQHEERGDLALGALGGLLVDVGGTRRCAGSAPGWRSAPRRPSPCAAPPGSPARCRGGSLTRPSPRWSGHGWFGRGLGCTWSRRLSARCARRSSSRTRRVRRCRRARRTGPRSPGRAPPMPKPPYSGVSSLVLR